MEIWKDIEHYEGKYQISNLGRIKSLPRICDSKGGKCRKVKGSILKQFIIKGYYYINLNDKGLKQFRVNILVAKHFITNPNNLPIVNHINCNKLDNASTNLEWCTAQYNTTHASISGLLKGKKAGEKHHNAKLSLKKVNHIRERLSKGEKGRLLSKEFRVSEGMISLIKHNKNWNI